MKKKLGVLVGAAPLGSERAELEELIRQDNVYKVAVDGGVTFFLQNRIRPDYWLGDMDSFKEKNLSPEDISHKKNAGSAAAGKTKGQSSSNKTLKNRQSVSDKTFLKDIKTTEVSPIKNDTDMALGVRHAFDNGCDEIIIYGGTGGERMAHTFANIQLMHHYAREGKKITMVSEQNRMFALHEDAIEFPKKEHGLVSVFALTDFAEGVKIKGLFYEFEGVLTNDLALGVSNEFCGRPASISVEKGTLLIVYVREN